VQTTRDPVDTSTFFGESMLKTTSLLSAVVTAALVAGAGIAAVPAQARVTSEVSGPSSITLLPLVWVDLSVAGVQIQGLGSATFISTLSKRKIKFPLTTPAERGVLGHSGIMSIAASLNRLDLASPYLEYAPEAGVTTGRITFEDENDVIGCDRITLFDVNNMSGQVRRGKVKLNKAAEKGAAWTRTDRQVITGDISLVDDSQFVSILNAYIGTASLTAGMDFGTLKSKVSATITCTTRRECQRAQSVLSNK
jgi:hypothetical protein